MGCKYEQVKKLLENYKMKKISIINMKKELEFLKEQNGLTGISYSGVSGGNTNKVTDTTSDTALRNIDQVEDKLQIIKKAQLELDNIDRALSGLTQTKREIIEGYYIHGMAWEQVAHMVDYSTRHCKDLRNQAINELANVHIVTTSLLPHDNHTK